MKKEINAVVAQLLKEGAVKEQVTIKSCSEYTKNDIARLRLVLSKSVRGVVADPETGEMTIGDTDTIFVSVSSVAAVLGENPDTAAIKKWVKEKPSSLEIILTNASIDVVSEDVKGDVAYVNPFSDDATPKDPKGYDSVYHHVVKIALSPKGMRAVEKIEDAINYDSKIIVEEMVKNLTEVNISVLGNYERQSCKKRG